MHESYSRFFFFFLTRAHLKKSTWYYILHVILNKYVQKTKKRTNPPPPPLCVLLPRFHFFTGWLILIGMFRRAQNPTMSYYSYIPNVPNSPYLSGRYNMIAKTAPHFTPPYIVVCTSYDTTYHGTSVVRLSWYRSNTLDTCSQNWHTVNVDIDVDIDVDNQAKQNNKASLACRLVPKRHGQTSTSKLQHASIWTASRALAP